MLFRSLPEYKAAPEITRERLYIETMEKVLGHTRKVLVNDKGGNLMVLPLDQMLKGGSAASAKKNDSSGADSLLRLPPASSSSSRANSNSSSAPASSDDNIMDQRRANAQRNDYQRQGE